MAIGANNVVYRNAALFDQALSGLSWPDLLSYFQKKSGSGFFPLTPGKAKHLELADAILHNRFQLNNELHVLPAHFDWRHNPSRDLEWLILLHKFYYLKDLACAYDFSRNEKYACKWVELIDSWMSQVPDGFIDTQVTGRRLQQWLLSYRYFVGKLQSPSIKPDFFGRFIQSVDSQTHYLCKHLTLEGNHRTLELYAIFVVAITFPELSSAGYFLEFSTQQLVANMKQDLLADGVHRELSSDYHHTVLKNYLRFRELAKLNQIDLPKLCDQLLVKALRFSYHAHKPDGFIPAINDGDCNSYLRLLKKASAIYGDEHLRYVATQGEQGAAPLHRSVLFQDSGYCILRSDWSQQPYRDAHYLFFDCAGLGFGSHGHYDVLSFEAAAFGHSLIVDPGRYTYSETGHEDGINWRHYFKSSAAHNTVVIDGLDQIAYQCERPVDPEPQAYLDRFVTQPGFDWVKGHVISQRYPVMHERSIFFLHSGYWIVTDRLTGDDSLHDIDLYFHLNTRAQDQVELSESADTQRILSPNLLIAQSKQDDVLLNLQQGYVSPEYGIKHPAPVVRFSQKQTASAVLQSVLYPFQRHAPQINIQPLPVFNRRLACPALEASASKIDIVSAQGKFEDVFFTSHCRDEGKYAFADIECQCGMLFLRRDASGKIISLQAEGVDFITVNGNRLVDGLNGLGLISFTQHDLTISQHGTNHLLQLRSLDTLPYWDILAALWAGQS